MSATHERPREMERDEATSRIAMRDLLTPLELAERWGVTPGHLANLRHQGEGIGYLKIGSRVAYRLADVLAYEDSVYVPVSAWSARVDM